MTIYLCSLANSGEGGDPPKELFTDDPLLADRFAESEDKRPGRGVYECINPLVPGARRRCLETVAVLQFIYFDLDLANIDATREQVIERLRNLPVEFVWVRDSGSGNLHVGVEIKDPPLRDTPEYDRVVAVWKRLAGKLAADPAPVHPAALIRRLGTHNKKNGGNGLCHALWNGGTPLDVIELEELDELLVEPLLARKPVATSGDDAEGNERKTPIDVDQRLAAMRFKGAGDASIHLTELHCTASLIRCGCSVDVAVLMVLEAVCACTAGDDRAKNWNWSQEEIDIRLMCCDLINKSPELSPMLPDNLRIPFEAAITAGRRPKVTYATHIGWHVRSFGPKTSGPQGKPGTGSSSPYSQTKGKVLELRPFKAFDVATLPPRSWLYGKHYQRKTVSLTAGPGGMGE